MSEEINQYKIKYDLLKELLETHIPEWIEKIDNLNIGSQSEYIELHIKFKIKIMGNKE